jgi:general secretion pathway protein E
VYEAIRIDDSIRQMINDGSDEDRISRHVFANAPTLSQSVLNLVRDGVTTAEEAIRVSRQDAGSEQL